MGDWLAKEQFVYVNYCPSESASENNSSINNYDILGKSTNE